MTDDYQQLLGDDGPLAQAISGFSPRPAQQQLAQAVAATFENNETLIAEAGTGTGKTFAYLLPAMLSGKKVIISTGTKNLQDQLFHRDLPTIRNSFAIPLKVALLKGRSNYLCLYRLDVYAPDNATFDKNVVADYASVQQWASRTRDGDIASVTDVKEDSAVWPWVTSNNDNCLGKECPQFEDCFIVKARRRAMQADILVINHHLFFADMGLREDGLGELLPDYDAIVFDEAHQLHGIASEFLGQSISSRQLTRIAQDAKLEALKEAKDMRAIGDRADELIKAILDTRLAFSLEANKQAWQSVAKESALQQQLIVLKEKLAALQEILQLASERSKGLDSCWQRSQELSIQLQQLTGSTPENQIHWYETFKKAFAFHFTPLTIAPQFREYLQQKSRAFVFTSATLSVASSFDHFAKMMGIDVFQPLQLASPFDYQRQAVLHFPRGMPNPNEPDFLDKLLQATLPLIEASGGRTFFLFTSHRALQLAAKWLAVQVEYPLLIQGERPKAELLTAFCESGNAILLGTSSFWEGVDVRGRALSLVIIDKLPFASPADPILQARNHALQQQGKQPFYEHSLPSAVIALKQGAGRLIRDENDRGVLMIGDPRLTGRAYGELFLRALPPMQRTRSSRRACEFLECNNEIISD